MSTFLIGVVLLVENHNPRFKYQLREDNVATAQELRCEYTLGADDCNVGNHNHCFSTNENCTTDN